ncbi:lipopolysaccharide export system permease protein [Flavobacterium hercynium]|nr:lipopolysaccharide export system permease protein [Flavobacterium hercynium]
MKILDKYLLKTFLITFATVFVILFFIFILQTVWLFIAELAGKDLDLMLVIKFLLFSMPRIIPLVLPLSVLLASIMSFGNLAENYEFAAMKSSGISLQRAMRPLTVFILILSIVAFWFANNVIPYAEYKFINFRKNIAQAKPAMAIAEGQFNDVGTYNIKVNKKSGENGNILTGVTIHEKANNMGENKTVIKAKDGELISSEKSSILKLVLNDGYYYQDVVPKKFEDRTKLPFVKAAFKKQIINIDLSDLSKIDEDKENVSGTNGMLNINELRYTLDSLNKNYKNEIVSFTENINQRVGLKFSPKIKKTEKKKKALPNNLLSIYNNKQKADILRMASSTVTNNIYSIEATQKELKDKQRDINKHYTALYEKFVIAFACFLMFFIGAPLGAIIRKGGLGLPIVFAILIFITFHFINTFGKRLSQEGGMSPFLGCWMSSFILAPLAILLTYRATNDNGLISFDVITDPFVKLFNKFSKEFSFKEEIITLDSIEFNTESEEYLKYSKMEDSVLIRIVKNAEQFEYTSDQRITILKILETRGITQDDLLAAGDLYNLNYFKLKYYFKLFQNQSIIIFILYAISIGLSAIRPLSFKIVIIQLVCLILFYVLVNKSNKTLSEISKITNKSNFINPYITLILGFPLYIFFYFYNKNKIKEILAEFNK